MAGENKYTNRIQIDVIMRADEQRMRMQYPSRQWIDAIKSNIFSNLLHTIYSCLHTFWMFVCLFIFFSLFYSHLFIYSINCKSVTMFNKQTHTHENLKKKKQTKLTKREKKKKNTNLWQRFHIPTHFVVLSLIIYVRNSFFFSIKMKWDKKFIHRTSSTNKRHEWRTYAQIWIQMHATEKCKKAFYCLHLDMYL